ncbi:hypothetical protein Pdsh_06550 [Pyrodictium delaneyi]|uniref:Uncharacterized protein n=1 Tax=Pyrodictium delaneyi TaxID=1273541 RepID=A0A211YN62_9CREN|nr:hypothetical protein Pdsh_06765 [Pyrodictium delaneyi]OWJ54672.1 hypothetical protein Pdsh_06550 [Pyrodictium delaneyi]
MHVACILALNAIASVCIRAATLLYGTELNVDSMKVWEIFIAISRLYMVLSFLEVVLAEALCIRGYRCSWKL